MITVTMEILLAAIRPLLRYVDGPIALVEDRQRPGVIIERFSERGLLVTTKVSSDLFLTRALEFWAFDVHLEDGVVVRANGRIITPEDVAREWLPAFELRHVLQEALKGRLHQAEKTAQRLRAGIRELDRL